MTTKNEGPEAAKASLEAAAVIAVEGAVQDLADAAAALERAVQYLQTLGTHHGDRDVCRNVAETSRSLSRKASRVLSNLKGARHG
jgi:hypothetical protein